MEDVFKIIKDKTNHKPLSKVNCFSEDGELKEVIFPRRQDRRLAPLQHMSDLSGRLRQKK